MSASSPSGRRPVHTSSAPDLARWARHVARDHRTFKVLDELDFLLLAGDDRLRQQVRAACEDGLTALDRAVAGQHLDLLDAARDAASRAMRIVESVGGDRFAALAAARNDALRILGRRGVLAPGAAELAARSAPGTAALAYATVEVERSGGRRGVHRTERNHPVRDPRTISSAVPPDPKAVDPGAVLGVALVAVAVVVAVAALVGALGVPAAMWGSTAAVFGGVLVLVASGGRATRNQPAGRLTSAHLTGVAMLGGISTVASTVATVSDPLTGRYFGVVLCFQAMSVVGIAALATQVRRAERHRR